MTIGHRRIIIGGMMGTLLVGAVTACGNSATQSSAPNSAAPTNTITLSEMKVEMPTTLPVGRRSFTITNNGRITHELLVFRSTLSPEKYPIQTSGAIAEDGPGIVKISDGENLGAGLSQTRDVDLSQPGTYLFVCNLPGHFAAHMYSAVTVGA